MKIGLRLGIVFSVLLVVIALIIFLVGRSYKDISFHIEDITKDKYSKTIQAYDVKEALVSSADGLKLLMISPDEQTKLKVDKIMHQATNTVDSNLAIMRAAMRSKKSRDLLDELNKMRHNEYYPAREIILGAISTGDMELAKSAYFGEFSVAQNKYNLAVEDLIIRFHDRMIEESELATKVADDSKSRMNIIGLASLILAIILAYYIIRSITKPLNHAVDAAEKISNGDLNVDLSTNSKDEIGVLIKAMQIMALSVKNLVEETNILSNAAIKGELDVRADSKKFQGEFRSLVEGINGTLDAVIKPLNVTAEYVNRISKGDIPSKIIDNYNGDYNEIKNNLNMLIDTLNLLLIDTKTMSLAAADGNLDVRADITKQKGVFRDLLAGLNQTVDNMVRPLNVTAEYVDRISKGDMPSLITDEYQGDYNEIKNNLNMCILSVRAMIADVNMLATAAVEGRLDTRAEASKHLGDFRKIVDGVNATLDSVIRPLNVTAEYVDRISKGDMPPLITDHYEGDFNEIKDNLNQCIVSVKEMIKDINFLSKAAVDGHLDARADAWKHQGDFRKIVEGVNNTLNTVIGPLNVSAEYIDRISKGNLPPIINEYYNGDFNNIKNNINHLIETLNTFNSEVSKMNESQAAGDIDVFINSEKFTGVFNDISVGVNLTVQDNLDAVAKILKTIREYSDNNFEHRLEEMPGKKKVANEYLNRLRDDFVNMIDEIKAIISAVSIGDLKYRGDVVKHSGTYKEIIKGFNDTLEAVIAPIDEAGDVLSEMALGDLTVRMSGIYKGDFEKLKSDVNKLGVALNDVISQVNEAVLNTATSVNQITASSEMLATAVQQQSSQADEVASAVEEMARTVTDNAQGATQTAHLAKDSANIAQEGGAVVQQTVQKMNDIALVVEQSAKNIEKLGESSKAIGEIISVIDDIADQTNLLALNAAIEAARAGEQGRGFAVVADEVRKLAERTTEATKQIADMIKGIQVDTNFAVAAMNQGTKEVQAGITFADKAGIALQDVLSSSHEVTDMISQIAAASEEQSATTEEISKNVMGISTASAESARQVEEVANTTEKMAQQTQHLNELMLQFKVDGGDKANKSLFGGRRKLLN